MKRYFVMFLSFGIVLSLLAACAPVTRPAPGTGGAGIANPASENCVAQGGTLEIRQGDGGEVGYCVFPAGSECEEWALLRGECKPGQSAAPQSLAYAPDLAQRAARLKPVTVQPTVDTSQLEPWERQVLEKLLQAAVYMDAAFWQQVDPEGEQIFRSLDTTNPDHAALHLLMDANYGRWDRFDNFAPFVGDQPRPPGGYVYPPDLTKAELDAYVAAHPDEKDALLSSYTVVQRDDDKLIAVPYHEVFAAYVEPTAALLEEAAALSQNGSLTDYLQKQAQALRTDDYFDADMAWLDLDANLDISIGPHETYDDQLSGQKTFYKANVLVVDRAAGARLDAFKAAVPAEQANLPVPAAYRPDQAGTMTPLELADDVLRSGQGRAVMEPVAFSLPNDPRVWEAKGAKKVIMRNFVDARRAMVLNPLLAAIMDEETNSWVTADGYFNWLLGHEVSHTLGPRTVMQDGKEVTVHQALGEYYQPIEEGKADITSLYNTLYLRKQGIDTEKLEAHYAGFLAEALRSIRFGPASAYGVIRSAAWNYFVEQGGLVYDAAAGKFSVDMAKMPQAVEELMVTLLTIEGEGDAAAAKAFIEKYSYIAPELQALLDQANATVPVEFVPMYAAD